MLFNCGYARSGLNLISDEMFDIGPVSSDCLVGKDGKTVESTRKKRTADGRMMNNSWLFRIVGQVAFGVLRAVSRIVVFLGG